MSDLNTKNESTLKTDKRTIEKEIEKETEIEMKVLIMKREEKHIYRTPGPILFRPKDIETYLYNKRT